ncbi:MAG: hypothetical protein HC840_17065 [Leptolyngbyaceae cyanobacterium RM2_2_4]|nr:hypothetical protein [Leptolyngbyaceae cyanobacterium SM1_4_3]NJN92079.1 hypothetical protein [Leptolyngbyaceae cyanobacterium SL_5_14]NJO50867.1 hypothetical protein [Leptolyngbyaceae cyanobacterium RM2_2_4]
MFFILVIVIGLVAWALHLMQEAVESREFSLMLAGFLVSAAAAAMMAVYFLMGHYVGYMSEMAQHAYLRDQFLESQSELADVVWTVDLSDRLNVGYLDVPTLR